MNAGLFLDILQAGVSYNFITLYFNTLSICKCSFLPVIKLWYIYKQVLLEDIRYLSRLRFLTVDKS